MDDQGRFASGTLAGIQINGVSYPVTVGAGLTLTDGTLSAGGGSGSGLTLGGAVAGGAAGEVLYVDASAKLAQAAGVQIDATDGRLFTTATIADPGFFGATTRISFGIMGGKPALVAEVNGSYNWTLDFDGPNAYLHANGANMAKWNVTTGVLFLAGLGVQQNDASGNPRTCGALQAGLSDNAAATWKGFAALVTYDVSGTAREAVRAGSDGTQTLAGFFGAAPVAKPSLAYSRTGESAAAAALRAALAALGLVADNTVA